MRRLYIGLLLIVIPWAGPACAQAAEIWNAQDDEDQEIVANGPSNGTSYNNWWFSADLLMWWTKATSVPVPLATTAPASALTNPADTYPPGNLANRDTTVVLGGSNVAIPMQFGGRFTMGAGLDDDGRFGVETGFLFLPTRSSTKIVASSGSLNQFLTNPYTALDSVAFPPPGTPYANFLSGPNSFNGPLAHFGAAKLVNKLQIYGAELNGVWNAWEGNGQSWHLLGGYRFFNVGEQLSLATTQVDNNNFTGQFINTLDQFKTQNFFNGGQLGIRWDWRQGNWYLGSIVKVAAGSTHEEVTINGSTTTNTGTAYTHIPVTTVPYGTYAQPTNIGHYTRDQFAWLPDVSLKLGFQFAPAVRYYVGYNFLYLSNMVRPGSQMDGTINPLQTAGFNGGLPTSPSGGGRPAPRFETTDFWVQGVTIGAEFGW